MKDYIKKVAVTLLVIISFILVPLFLYYTLPFFMPFIIAFLFALLLEPFNTWLMKSLKINRPIAVNISYFLFFGGGLLLAYFITTKIIKEAIELLKYIQRNIPAIQVWFNDIYQQTQDFVSDLPIELILQINQAYTNFMIQLSNINILSSLGTYTVSLTTAIPNFFFQLLMFFIALYMMSFGLDKITERFYSYFKDSSKRKVKVVLTDLRNATFGFLKAQVILSAVTYIISLVGLALLDIRYATLIALLIVIVDILPILGTGSFLMPWAVLSITQGEFIRALGLFLLFIVITVFRKIIEPKVLGERIGLGPLSTLISIWVGLKVAGILGVFLAPLLIIFYKALVKAKVISYRLRI